MIQNGHVAKKKNLPVKALDIVMGNECFAFIRALATYVLRKKAINELTYLASLYAFLNFLIYLKL